MKKDKINKCQYWEVNEPFPCTYWDNENLVCTYKFQDEFNVDAESAPYCNLLGTDISCSKYKSTSPGDIQARCILPDSRRHVCNRSTGYKWVTSTSGNNDASDISYETRDWDFDPINGYNDGQCNGAGTDTTCSGYSPYHLGFGVLKPSNNEDLHDTFKENRYSKTEEFGYRLPTNFVIYNLRATLSKCHHWNGAAGKFIVDAETGQVELDDTWLCTSSNDTSKYSEFTLEGGPPCNGCKPECPYYTGVCWQYCVDEKMEDGDPILAEQIHELRYYHRENRWTVDDIERIFIDDGTIFTWDGQHKSGDSFTTLKGDITLTVGDPYSINTGGQRVLEYEIPAIRSYMDDFDRFDPKVDSVVLTQDTTVTKYLKDYPTLIREIQQLPLSPVIKNKYTEYTDAAGEEHKYFEVASLQESCSMLVYGKTFYNTSTKAINISDKEISKLIPLEVYAFEDNFRLEMLSPTTLDTEDVYTKLKAALTTIALFYPDKIAVNELDEEDLTFISEVPILNKNLTSTNTNENIIMVWQELDDFISFSTTKFTKRLVGGVLSQSEFTLEGDGKPLPEPFDFEWAHRAQHNKNGKMVFNFIPFVTDNIASSASHYFNDSVIQNPLTTDRFKGYTKYKYVASEFILEDGDFEVLGSNGYILINLDHPVLNSVFEPFTFNKINVKYTLDNPNYGDEDEEETITRDCEMELVHHGADRLLGQQQLIVKPKDEQDLASACDVWITIEDFTFYDKRSYGEEPIEAEFFEVSEEDDGINSTLDQGELSSGGGVFTLENFGDTNTPCVVINNCQGKPFTVYRTKAVTSVKQPCCPDVEIYYNWRANYIEYQNHPICKCCGKASQIDPSQTTKSWTPYCGDHFQNNLQKKGPMWWPYNTCLEWDTYEQLTNLNNFSLDVIGLYQMKGVGYDGKEVWIHGSHDMRMQGPHKYYGRIGLGCNPLKPCSCNMRTYNYEKYGDHIFEGYAKIRGGIPTSQLEVWQMTNSLMPKFGNASRPFLRSYRSLDAVPYLDAMGTGVIWKLMPASMMFNQADITTSEDPMWRWHCSGDGPNVVNPMGFLLAQTFDGVNVNEEIDEDNRFRHEDIFRCKSTVDIAYQHTTGSYVRRRGEDPLIPWYEFKRYPVAGSDSFVQWAWQENWKDLQRNYNEDIADTHAFMKTYLEEKEDLSTKGPFINETPLKGLLLTLSAEHSDYLYDYKNKEYRQIPDEGTYVLKFKAPIKEDNTGEYIGYPSFSLGNGPSRAINWEGDWLTEENQDGIEYEGSDAIEEFNVELYDKCIGDKHKSRETIGNKVYEYVWSDDVTLFAEGYDNQSRQVAEDEERMCETYYQEVGDISEYITLKTYFQRGLDVSINKGNLSELPLELFPVDQYALTAGQQSISLECLSYKDSEDNPITDKIGFQFDNLFKTIGVVEISYDFGAKIISPAKKGIPATYKYHHKPQINIYSSDDGITTKDLLTSTDSMEIFSGTKDEYETKKETIVWTNDWDYIASGAKGLIIEFRCYPTDDELNELSTTIRERFDSTINTVKVVSGSLKEEVLADAVEYVNINERKYYVSHGKSGDLPPQGTDDDEDLRVLGKRRGNDRSTVWQTDTSANYAVGSSSKPEVNDVPNSSGKLRFMNKVRGRIVYEGYADGTPASESEDVIEMEDKQKELFDLAISEMSTTSTMKGVIAPPLKQLLTNAGIVFAGPRNLVLKNDVVQPLVSISNAPQMSGEGHKYIPGEPKKEDCRDKPSQVLPDCMDNGLAGDAFIFDYTNMDKMIDEDILTNAVLYKKDENGYWVIDSEGTDVTSANQFRVDTEDTYGTTGSNPYGNPFDTLVTNPIVQLYAGRAWQIERTKMYESLMDSVFPALFDRPPSDSIYAEDYTQLVFLTLNPASYGGIFDPGYTPSKGYSRQPADLHWTDTQMWPGFDPVLHPPVFGF